MLTTLFESFYSPAAYRRISEWRGKAILYLALILALCWIPVMIHLQMNLNKAIARFEERVLPTLPVVTFSKGKVSTPENRPYIFRYGQGNDKVGFILDTSGKYTSLQGLDDQFLLTRDTLFFRKQSGETRMVDLSKSKMHSFVLDHEAFRKMTRFFQRFSILLLYPITLFFSFLKRLIQAFFIALVGLAIAYALDVRLDLGALLSLAIVAMTPAMILQTLWSLVGKPIGFVWLIWAGMILAYFIFAINAAARPALESEE